MRKLIYLLFILPLFASAQDAPPVSPFTSINNMQWYQKVVSGDTILYGKGSDLLWRNLARRKWVLAQIAAISGSFEVTSNKTSTQSSSATLYPNWLGITAYVVPLTRLVSTTLPATGGGNLGGNLTIGIAGLTGYGTSNQLVRMNTAATGWEYFTAPYYSLGSFTTGSIIFYNGTTFAQDNSNFYYDATNHRIGLGTTSPTQTITIASTGSGITQYNTSDQTVNYDRVRQYFTGNEYLFSSQKLGTGTVRDFKFAGGQVRATNVQTGTSGTDSLVVISSSTFKKIPANYYSTGSAVVEITGTTQQAVVNTIYIPHNASLTSITLPVTSVIGSLVQVIGEGAGGWKILQNASQQIVGVGISTTTGTGGSLASTNANCTVTLRLTNTNKWTITTNQGTLTPL